MSKVQVQEKKLTITVKTESIKLLKQIKLQLLKEKEETFTNNDILLMLINKYKEDAEYRKKVDECLIKTETEKADTHGVLVTAYTKYELMKLSIEKDATLIKLVDCLTKSYV